MAENTSELSRIMSRLEQVEKENRTLKSLGTVILLALGAALLMGQSRTGRTVEAENFVLRDNRGNVRATLGIELEDRPTLTFKDARGLPLVSLAGGDDPFLTLKREGGQEQVQIGVNKDLYGLAIYGEPKGAIKGTRVGLGVWKGIPSLTLYDENGNERAAVQTEQSGPSLRLSDVNGKGRVELSMASSDMHLPGLTLFDKGGKSIASFVGEDAPFLHLGRYGETEHFLVAVAPNVGPYVSLSDKEGFMTAIGSTDLVTPRTGETHKTSAASVVLFGKDQKVLWSAP